MRVVSLLPSVTEILFAVGAGDDVVGVTHECDYPPAARGLPVLTASLLPPELQTHAGAAQVGAAVAERAARIDRHVRANVHGGSTLYALDEAQLARLEPDLIITQELCAVCAVSYDIVARAAKRLRGDPRIVSLEPSSLEDVYANIAYVGELVGRADRAQALVAALRARESALRAAARGRPRARTLVLEWPNPPMSAGHWTPDLVDAAGGEPVLAHPHADSRRLEWNAVHAADPDVVILAPCGYDLTNARAAAADLEREPGWRELRAVREGRAYAMDGNAYVNRPGPRLVDTAEIFAAAIAGTPSPEGAVAAVPVPSALA